MFNPNGRLMELSKLNTKQKQIYEQFKDDPDFDMEKALAKFQKTPTQARQVRRIKDSGESISRELRLVIEILHRKVELVQRTCGVCGRTFAADYLYVAFCSDTCRAEHIYQESGIVWNPEKPERERWGGEPPSVIKPETLEFLVAFAQSILAIPEAVHYIGREVPRNRSNAGPDMGNEPVQRVQPIESVKSARTGKSEAPSGQVRDVSSAHVKAIREGDTAKALKEKLETGEITKVEYQLALADLF